MKAWLIGFAIPAGWALYYAGSCWWFPFGHCWCCKGRGRHTRKDGKVFKDCWWCGASGRRLRLGRRIYNHVHGVKSKSS